MGIVLPYAAICLMLWAPAAADVSTQGAQKKTPPVAKASRPATSLADELLRRSYVMGRSFSLQERCFQLFRLAQAASQIPSPLGKSTTNSWSRELFLRSFDLPPDWNRAALQKNSLVVLSAVDPVAALSLLRKVDVPANGDAEKISEDLRASAAQTIFFRLLEAKGTSSLGAIRTAAREIGQTGEYPYLAMGVVSRALVARKNLGSLVSIHSEALDFYSRGPRVRSADKDFITFTEADWQYLTSSLQQESLRVIAAHLLRERRADGSVTEVTRVVTDNGTASFQGERIALLYSILPKIREANPRWAEQIEDDHPELKQAAAGGQTQYSSSVRVVNTTGASPEQVSAAADAGLQTGVLYKIRQTAAKNPDEAAGLLPSLTTAEYRSEALAALAVAYSGADPKRAAELLASARMAADQLPDNAPRLRALTAVAKALLELRDFSQANTTIQDAFDLGEEIVSEDLDIHPGEIVYMSEGLETLSSLVELGMQVAPQLTLARIYRLNNETLQAYLLIAGVEGLEKKAV